MNIVWKNLPKPQGMFTRRNTIMVALDTKKAIQFYSANTKIQVTQYALFNDSVYFRTKPAEDKNLNWAIKADSFDLPKDYIASLAPNSLSDKKASPKPSFNNLQNKKVSKKAVPSKNEGTTQPRKNNIFKRLIGRFKKGK